MKKIFTVLLGVLIFIGLTVLPIETIKGKVIFAVLMALSYVFGFVDRLINEDDI